MELTQIHFLPELGVLFSRIIASLRVATTPCGIQNMALDAPLIFMRLDFLPLIREVGRRRAFNPIEHQSVRPSNARYGHHATLVDDLNIVSNQTVISLAPYTIYLLPHKVMVETISLLANFYALLNYTTWRGSIKGYITTLSIFYKKHPIRGSYYA